MTKKMKKKKIDNTEKVFTEQDMIDYCMWMAMCYSENAESPLMKENCYWYSDRVKDFQKSVQPNYKKMRKIKEEAEYRKKKIEDL